MLGRYFLQLTTRLALFQFQQLFYLLFLIEPDHGYLMGAVQDVRVRPDPHHLALLEQDGMQKVELFLILRHPPGNLNPHQRRVFPVANIEIEKIQSKVTGIEQALDGLQSKNRRTLPGLQETGIQPAVGHTAQGMLGADILQLRLRLKGDLQSSHDQIGPGFIHIASHGHILRLQPGKGGFMELQVPAVIPFIGILGTPQLQRSIGQRHTRTRDLVCQLQQFLPFGNVPLEINGPK